MSDKKYATPEEYEEVLADHRRLVRELDVAMHGEENAAPQASLCDLIQSAHGMRERIEALEYIIKTGFVREYMVVQRVQKLIDEYIAACGVRDIDVTVTFNEEG